VRILTTPNEERPKRGKPGWGEYMENSIRMLSFKLATSK